MLYLCVPPELLIGSLWHGPLVLGHMGHCLQLLVDLSSEVGLLQVVI